MKRKITRRNKQFLNGLELRGKLLPDQERVEPWGEEFLMPEKVFYGCGDLLSGTASSRLFIYGFA